MSFRTLDQRVAIATVKPASIRLVTRRQASRPACLVSLRMGLAKQLKWKKGDKVAVQLGEGDDTGKLRIVRNGKPAISEVRELKGGYMFDLGFVAPLNDGHASDLIPIDASMINADTVELLLPDWSAVRAYEEIEHEEAEESEQRRATPIARRPQSPPPAAKANGAKPAPHDPPVTHNGVMVTFAPDDEAVAHRGKSMEVTARQAQLVAMLARGMPQPIDRAFLKSRMFDPKIAAHADGMLDTMAMDLSKALPGIGLVLKNVKGVGFALQVKE